jgi:hypothetical protein
VLHHSEPEACILSVRGHSFDFERGLSPAVSECVELATERLVQLVAREEWPFQVK